MSQHCWWCCHPIPGEMYRMPYKCENGKFLTCGQFCGWPCVKAYNVYSGSPRTGLISDLISQMRLKMYNELKPVKTAPPRFSLKIFGGTLSIEQFRSGTLNVRVQLPNEPWIHIPSTTYKKHETVVENGDLVLKRTKPMKREQSGLQKLVLKNPA